MSRTRKWIFPMQRKGGDNYILRQVIGNTIVVNVSGILNWNATEIPTNDPESHAIYGQLYA
jgi:hypothetical protein